MILAAGGYTTVNTLSTAFSNLTSLAVDGGGNVFAADYGASAVKEIVAAGGYTTVKTLAGSFSSPRGLSADSRGNVYVSDDGTGTILKLDYADPPGSELRLHAGRSHQQRQSEDGHAGQQRQRHADLPATRHGP